MSELFGICVVGTNGNVYAVGDAEHDAHGSLRPTGRGAPSRQATANERMHAMIS